SLDLDTGAEAILHAFQGNNIVGSSDGAAPFAGCTFVNGTLYGTTRYGGTGSCNYVACGTIFSIDPATGSEKVPKSFQRFKAEYPGGLINVTGTLYGTTLSGGKGGQCDEGCGTVFSFDLSSGKEAVV